MNTIEHLRDETEEDATEAMVAAGAALSIEDAATMAIVLGRMLGGPVTEDDVVRALRRSYVGLPIETPAAVLEAFNCHPDVLLGEGAASPDYPKDDDI